MSKYIYKKPIENDSVEEKPIALLKSLVGLFLIFLGAYFLIMVVGSALISKMPFSLENKLFSQSTIKVLDLKENTQYNDSLTNYYSPLFDSLVELSDLKDYKLNFIILDDSILNAFAAPGGTVIFYKSLIDTLAEYDNIAFVMGHEIGHIVHRDNLNSMFKALSLGIISSIFSGNVAFENILGSTLNQINLKFSKKQELEADRYGAYLLNKLHPHSNGAVDALEKLAQISKFGKLVYIFASDHPEPQKRILKIKQYLKKIK